MKLNKFIISAITLLICLNIHGNEFEEKMFKDYKKTIKNKNKEIKLKVEKKSVNILKNESRNIIEKISENFNNNNFENEDFSIKLKIFINSNGFLRYTVLEQSLNGYKNKMEVIKIIEETRKKSFKNEMETIGNDEKEKYKYKEVIFDLEIGNIEKYY